jgi:hypothetical protein
MKRILAAMTAALLLTALVAGTAVAAKPTTTNLMGQGWRIQYLVPATSALWDINKVKLVAGEPSFPVKEFDSKTTGSFAVYFQTNWNTSLAGTTLTATADWADGTYETRSNAFDGAYGRFWFQDAIGNYTSNSYWWYSGDRLDLNGSTSGTLSASLTNRAHWSNLCGQVATDTTAHPGDNCVGGTDPAVSPYDGFTNAMKNVKQLGISFGSAGSYASGIALVDGPGPSSVSAFTINS